MIVIGAGAAGLLGATRAAERGRLTLLLEKNRKPGVKILMSGGTRCNLTQATDVRGIVAAFGLQGKFLHSALARLGPQDLVDLIEAEGVPTKVEETGKIFPASDKAADVLNALLQRLHRSGAKLALGEPVRDIQRSADHFTVVTESRTLTTKSVLLTTGGQSYPGSGTTGDGYAWARRFGHTIVPPRPALVPITTNADWVRTLSGITIPDVSVRVLETSPPLSKGGQGGVALPTDAPSQSLSPLASRRASFLFTHFGLSGPAVLDVSRAVTGHSDPSSLLLECDFLPDSTDAEFEDSLKYNAAAAGRKSVAAILPDCLPQRLIDALLAEASLIPEQRAAELSKAQRAQLVRVFRHCQIPISGTLGFKKAEVTAGGVSLDEVDSRTMQSKLVPGLFLAGEILDLDGPIGGYNFQAAFSTGWLAGESV